MEKVAIVNQKGGVAKTTTAINFSGCLAENGKNVLLIDLDPQSNLTTGIGLKNTVNTEINIYDVMKEKVDLVNAIHKTKHINNELKGSIDVITSSINLANAELELGGKIGRETILRDIYKKSKENLESKYDYMIIDCNPSLGLLTINALVLADNVVIPIQPGVFAFEGIQDLLNTIKLIKNKFNEDLFIKSVLLTQVDGRANLSKEYKEKLDNLFSEKVCGTTINVNVKLNEAQDEGVPINMYDKSSKGYEDYKTATEEVFNLV